MAIRGFAILLSVGALLGFVVGEASAVQVDVYGNGSTTPYSDFVGTFDSPDVVFGTSTGFDWHPFGQANFGAVISGTLDVVADGTYDFALTSAHSSQLFVDGTYAFDGGPVAVTGSLWLTAGIHSFEIRAVECCDETSGVGLTLPNGVAYGETTTVPEPGTLLLLGLGLTSLAAFARLRYRAAYKTIDRPTVLLVDKGKR